jgi:hypothetical protein
VAALPEASGGEEERWSEEGSGKKDRAENR